MNIEAPNFKKEGKPDYFNSLEYLTDSEREMVDKIGLDQFDEVVLYFIKSELFFSTNETMTTTSKLTQRLKEQSEKRGIPYEIVERRIMLNFYDTMAMSNSN